MDTRPLSRNFGSCFFYCTDLSIGIIPLYVLYLHNVYSIFKSIKFVDVLGGAYGKTYS